MNLKKQGNIDRQKKITKRDTHTLIAEERKTTRPSREYTNTNS